MNASGRFYTPATSAAPAGCKPCSGNTASTVGAAAGVVGAQGGGAALRITLGRDVLNVTYRAAVLRSAPLPPPPIAPDADGSCGGAGKPECDTADAAAFRAL